VYPCFLPVVGQNLPTRQVEVKGVELSGGGVVDVPLLPCHVTTTLLGVDMQPIRGHHAYKQTLYSRYLTQNIFMIAHAHEHEQS
jgi:hypothetical protein